MKSFLKIAAAAAVLFTLASCNDASVKLPVKRSFTCDVLVIGGGPAGTASAISAARHGAKTILAERNGVLGGTATAGLVAPFMSSTTPDGKTFLIRGLYEDLVDRMVAEGGAIHPLNAEIGSWTAYRDKGHHGLTTFDYECLKRTLEQMCTEAGVDLMYHMLFIKADTRGGKIKAAYFATKDGIWKVTAKQYIDWQRNIVSDNRAAFFAEYPQFASGLSAGKVKDRNKEKPKPRQGQDGRPQCQVPCRGRLRRPVVHE